MLNQSDWIVVDLRKKTNLNQCPVLKINTISSLYCWVSCIRKSLQEKLKRFWMTLPHRNGFKHWNLIINRFIFIFFDIVFNFHHKMPRRLVRNLHLIDKNFGRPITSLWNNLSFSSITQKYAFLFVFHIASNKSHFIFLLLNVTNLGY